MIIFTRVRPEHLMGANTTGQTIAKHLNLQVRFSFTTLLLRREHQGNSRPRRKRTLRPIRRLLRPGNLDDPARRAKLRLRAGQSRP